MSLFMKQDFSPPVLSRKWVALKFRPNVLLHSREYIISILESGLMFREDSVEVEQEAPAPEAVWITAGGGKSGWLTGGERNLAALAVGACVLAFPPKSLNRSTLINVTAYIAIPMSVRIIHRMLSRGNALRSLLTYMRDYLSLARRAQAALKHMSALHNQLESISQAVDSTHRMLCRQQWELAGVLCRASAALLGNVPWLRADLAWEAAGDRHPDDGLTKIHHAFLVVQSTLLKHIAMAHFVPPAHARTFYKNHNERIYWLHNVLIDHLSHEFKENYEALDRMYRLLKNIGNKDTNIVKKPGFAINDSWLYSEVHTGVASACLELKMAANRCTQLDMFLDNCALNKQDLDLDVLNKDIDDLIDDVSKSLNTVQNSQLRLKKLQAKFGAKRNEVTNNNEQKDSDALEESTSMVMVEDAEPQTRDEVFYFVKTEDDEVEAQPAADVTTAPGKKERDTTKVVLNELKRKLVKREDLMRERERQALAKTMPEFKDKIPEFPRQMADEFADKKGFISKLIHEPSSSKLFRNYKIQSRRNKANRCMNKLELKVRKYAKNTDITDAIVNRDEKSPITIATNNNKIVVTKWRKKSSKPDVEPDKENVQNANKPDVVPEFNSSDMSDGLSDVESNTINRVINQAINNGHSSKELHTAEARNLKFSKKDLELSPSSESDGSFYENRRQQLSILKDVRRHRAFRKKNHPAKRGSICESTNEVDYGKSKTFDEVDEGLRPVEYSFGTGMAIASVLQVNGKAVLPNMAQEEVFIGDGEVSADSGNDEDA